MQIPSSGFKLITYTSTSINAPLTSGPRHPSTQPSGPISLRSNSTWTHCGPVLNLSSLPRSLLDWIRATIEGNLLPLLLPFLAFIHSLLADSQIDHYWLTIRATKATHDFDLPRWHTDNGSFDRIGKRAIEWKLCTTLLGPGTLFVADGGRARTVQKKAKRAVKKSDGAVHECKTVRCLGCADMQQTVRVGLADRFREYETVQADGSQCAIFRVGDEHGAVHSEPTSHGDRVFVNVIPGSELEIRGLTDRWGMAFPRDWSLAWQTGALMDLLTWET